MRRVGLLVIIIAGSLFGTCAANSASNIFGASFSQQAGQVWSFQTPFGIIYGTIPREVVDYPTAHSTGTIVVSTSQRRLYYVLGGGVSSGFIRMSNDDVVDLYSRAKIGAPVIVQR